LLCIKRIENIRTGIKTTPFNAVFGKEAYNGLDKIKKDIKTINY